jgi:glycosyltransferase involved in cell wall biosynthesis
MRVAVTFQRFGPYHHARLRAASASIDEVVGIEVNAADSTYNWSQIQGQEGFDRVTLFSQDEAENPPFIEIQTRIHKALRSAQPDVVAIPGWSSQAAVAALSWSARTGTPSVIMSESSRRDSKRTRTLEWMKTRYVGCFSAALVGGQLHSDYLVQLGMNRDRIFAGYDVVDNDHFWTGARQARERGTLMGQDLGSSKPFFLAVSRFVEKKNLLRMIASYATYRAHIEVEPWDLVLLGDGPQRRQLADLGQKLSLEGSLHLPGFIQYEELPTYYGLAEAFIHPSTTEQWGLVVNEAMAAGLPVIVSNRCGCVPELVEPGGNGYIFNPLDEDDLAESMSKVHADPNRREKMGRRSLEVISEWDVSRFASGLLRAAETATDLGPAKRVNASARIITWILVAALSGSTIGRTTLRE